MPTTIHTLLTTFQNKRAAETDPPPLIDIDFIHHFTYHSNAIEGNALTLAETKQLLIDGHEINGKSPLDHVEALGHRDACLYMEQLSHTPKPITLQTMKELHSLLLSHHSERGKFRSTPVSIKGSLHQPALPFMVQLLLEQLLHEYETTFQALPYLERVALFHLRFESIHPFIDGNGRTGRLLLNLDLLSSGLPPICIRVDDVERYYEAFESFHETDRPTALTALLSDYLRETLQS